MNLTLQLKGPMPGAAWGRFPPTIEQRVRELEQMVVALAGIVGGGILNGTGDPNGVVEATGPAIYFDRTVPTAPVMYVKSTDGTSNNEWV
jgi:hypothetical protein